MPTSKQLGRRRVKAQKATHQDKLSASDKKMQPAAAKHNADMAADEEEASDAGEAEQSENQFDQLESGNLNVPAKRQRPAAELSDSMK